MQAALVATQMYGLEQAAVQEVPEEKGLMAVYLAVNLQAAAEVALLEAQVHQCHLELSEQPEEQVLLGQAVD